MDATEVLRGYRQFSPKVSPAKLLSGNIDKREGEITLYGQMGDDLNGAVRRRLLADINAYFYKNPLDVDDTRLVFEATEEDAKYEVKKDGSARLVLKIRVDLATNRPDVCCC